MSLVHTLLFMLRQEQDMKLAVSCLKSLENSPYKTIVIYNQGNLDNNNLENFLKAFITSLDLFDTGNTLPPLSALVLRL